MTRLRRWTPLMILLISLIVLFYRLFLGEVLFWGTPVLQFYAWRDYAFETLRSGILPLWNPLLGYGSPLLANYQTAVFYPPNWLYLIIPTEYAMGFVGLLHVLWAGVGMMAYLRLWKINLFGQGMAALAFGLSGFVISRFGFLTIVSTITWLPWLFSTVERLLAGGQDESTDLTTGGKVAALAGVVAMILLSGHAQIAFYSLLLAGCYAIYRVRQNLPYLRSRVFLLSTAVGAVVLGILIASIQLVPTFELMSVSQRANGVDAEAALSYSFWWGHFLLFIMPNLYGTPSNGSYLLNFPYWESAVYVGLLPSVLAVRAVIHRYKNRAIRQTPIAFFSISIVPVTIFAMGSNTPIFTWLFRNIPTFDLFNAPARWMALVVFSIAVLAGFGVQHWQTGRGQSKWIIRGAIVGLAILVSGILSATILRETIEFVFVTALLRLGVLLLVLLGFASLRTRVTSRKQMGRWELIVLVIVAVDLITVNWGLNPTISARYYHEHTQSSALIPENTRVLYLPSEEYYVKFDLALDISDFQADDLVHWDLVRESLLPNLSMLEEVPSGSNFDPLLIGEYADLLRDVETMSGSEQVGALRQMNIGLLLSPSNRTDLANMGSAGYVSAYLVPDPWPRATLADCVTEVDGLLCTRSDNGSVRVTGDDAEYITIGVTSSEPLWLLLIDTNYPGWIVSIDGNPAEIERANTAFRAVKLGSGAHRVIFQYRPWSIRLGGMGSALGLLVVFTLLGVNVWKQGSTRDP